MTEPSRPPDGTAGRYPLSCPQELWYSGDQGDEAGFFSPRFTMANALRISGRIDVAALQGALDDVVERHEILRTIVVRDAQPPYQQVHSATQVPLLVRDLPTTSVGRSRDLLAEELLAEAEQSTLSPRDVPLLRAALTRFDELDSVLTLVTHHTVCDEWSVQVIMRDLAACYAARTTGGPAILPRVKQYREFTDWQRAEVASAAAEDARKYWRDRMRGAQIFAVPTDRAVPESHTKPYSAHNFVVETDVMGAMCMLARDMKTSVSTVLLAAFNVLTHQIAGTTDAALDTLTTGRTDPQFDEAVGPLMNFLVFRTDIAECASFREVVASTRDACAEAYSHEIPIQHIEREVPELMEPNEDVRMTNCILGIFQPPFGEEALRIADDTHEIRKRALPTPIGPWIPHGVAWALNLLHTGELAGCVQFNVEDLDENTVADWASGYRRILSKAASAPDREWKTL
jgi:condensation enzyme